MIIHRDVQSTKSVESILNCIIHRAFVCLGRQQWPPEQTACKRTTNTFNVPGTFSSQLQPLPKKHAKYSLHISSILRQKLLSQLR